MSVAQMEQLISSANYALRVRSYVIRSGKMSDAQKRSYDDLFPLYGRRQEEIGAIDSRVLFGNGSPMTVEIGFGMGRATAEIAENNPGMNYLGIEVHRPGIGRLLWEIEKRKLQNIRIIEGDASEIIEKSLAINNVAAFHIFFPDPWPKKRHHKRRLITRPFTDLLASRLVPDGYIYAVSDWADYGTWMLRELSTTTMLVNKYGSYAEPQSWRPITEFEKKAHKAGLETRELFFLKESK